ncbi:MAG: DUF3604 domain-containing protein [Minicystis sp.]
MIAAAAFLAVPIGGCLASPEAPAREEAQIAAAEQPVAGPCACTPPPPSQCNGTGPNGYNPYKIAFFGDLHSHTSYSLDAYSFGTRSDPANAYLFAKSQATVDVGAATSEPPGPTIGQPRRLDFLAVTDHSEFLAMSHGCVLDQNSGYYNSNDCGLVRSTNATAQNLVFLGVANNLNNNYCDNGGNPADCDAQVHDAWQDIICAAQCAYQPCSFTSLVAYEWTDVDSGSTDHRNVIFGSDSVPAAPLSALDYPDPPALWTGLDTACTAANGCDVVTIPHNSNESDGVSLQVWDPSPDGLRKQKQYQVSVEIYQHKGSSECDANVAQWSGGVDVACNFETTSNAMSPPPATSFVRRALEEGLLRTVADPSGGNPLQLGFVAATDDHNGAPGYTDEALFVGHVGRKDDTPLKRVGKGSAYQNFGSGGLTGVWAEQNSRDKIFGAIKRRETFATSGPRMQVRFFQTSDAGACADPNFPKQIIDASTAVAMGGTFGPSKIGAGGKPMFAVWAWPDTVPQNLASGGSGVAGLSTVQIIKAHAHLDATTGAPVVVEDAPVAVSNFPSSGGCVMWTDTSWTAASASEQAFYYVRVLQQPTNRWSKNDCDVVKAQNPTNWQTLAPACQVGGGLNTTVRERAWTSPIWYAPQ